MNIFIDNKKKLNDIINLSVIMAYILFRIINKFIIKQSMNSNQSHNG